VSLVVGWLEETIRNDSLSPHKTISINLNTLSLTPTASSSAFETLNPSTVSSPPRCSWKEGGGAPQHLSLLDSTNQPINQ